MNSQIDTPETDSCSADCQSWGVYYQRDAFYKLCCKLERERNALKASSAELIEALEKAKRRIINAGFHKSGPVVADIDSFIAKAKSANTQNDTK